MKRLVSVLLMIGLLMGLTACGVSQKETANQLTIWHDKEDAVIAALEQALKQAVPELEIVFEKKTSLTDSLKLVGNDSSAAPDLFIFAHDKIGVFAEMGILAPIQPFLEDGALDQFLPMTIQAASYKGT